MVNQFCLVALYFMKYNCVMWFNTCALEQPDWLELEQHDYALNSLLWKYTHQQNKMCQTLHDFNIIYSFAEISTN